MQQGHKGAKRAHWSRGREGAPPARALPEGHARSQAWSSRANEGGSAFASDQLPVKPKLTEAPGATPAFQETFRTVTAVPDWAGSAFHIRVTFWSPGNDQPRDQPFQAEVPVLVTRTSAWKPPGHWFVTVYVTSQAPAGSGSGPVPGSVPPPVSEVSP
ncbi:hypothetical protein SVIOM342S_09191 [Streptomyces violaceorubidus]